ncbi:MAG: hypothetical protein CMK07_11055 [Ponticaulis sp.]|nr:hypothetical protein [Ponticaulis sp.]
MSEQTVQEAGERLIGWKRIALHLGCGERTARRWEAEEGLPVHRQTHETKSTVYAFPAELDGWVNSRSLLASQAVSETKDAIAPKPRWAWWLAGLVIVALVCVNLAGYFVLKTNREIPAEPVLTENREALDLYDRGIALWQQRGEDANRRAILLLSRAVELDEDFAEAWAALANAHGTYPTYSDETLLDSSLDNALLAADRALQLKPELVQPRTLMGEIAERRGDWPRSRQIFEEAMRAEPNNPTILIWAAGHFREAGYLEESLRLTRQTLQVEPNSPPALNELAMTTLFYLDEEEGEERLDYLWYDFGLDTPAIWFGKWFAFLWKEDFAAMREWQSSCPLGPNCAAFARAADVYAAPTDETLAAFAEEILDAYETGMPAWLAMSLIHPSNNVDAAYAIAEAESETGWILNNVIFYDPRVPDFRADPRLIDVTKRLGLFDYWTAYGPPDFCEAEPEASVCRALISGGD